MRGRSRALFIFLFFLVIVVALLLLKNFHHKKKVQHFYVPPKIPYEYKLSYKIIGAGKVEIIVNVTRRGNVPEELEVYVYKIIYPNITKEYTHFTLPLKTETKTIYLYYSLQRDVGFLVKIYDTFRHRYVAQWFFKLEPHKYKISAALLSNYSAQVNLTVLNYSIVRDYIIVAAKLVTSFGNRTIASVTLYPEAYTVPPLGHYYGSHYSLAVNGSHYQINFSWNIIGDISAQVVITVYDELFGKVLAQYRFNVTPPIIPANKESEVDKTGIYVDPVPVNINFDGNFVFSYKYYGHVRKINFMCKQLENIMMCYGLVDLKVQNKAKVGRNVYIVPGSIICENNLGAEYSWPSLKGILTPTSYHLEPMQGADNYIYCMLPRGTKLEKLYVELYIDNKPYELVIAF
ncbi:MAG: hypothetical protein GXO42_00495 [bacterium]|nr:hypothetical protein [bacterium]